MTKKGSSKPKKNGRGVPAKADGVAKGNVVVGPKQLMKVRVPIDAGVAGRKEHESILLDIEIKNLRKQIKPTQLLIRKKVALKDSLTEDLDNNTELADVMAYEVRDFVHHTVTVYRADDDKKLEERTMTEKDLVHQRDLEEKGKPPTRAEEKAAAEDEVEP